MKKSGYYRALGKAGIFVIAFAMALSGFPTGAPNAAAETPSEYVDLQFGMFPHYGINTYTNGKKGRQGNDPVSVNYPSTLFNPTDFDPYQWAEAASAAGMKYMIYTVKHHFGWSGYDSAYSTYDIGTSSVPNLDTVQEVKDACDDYGLKLVLYYSALDRTNYPDPKLPNHDWTNKNANYTQFVKNQMSELLTNYGTITGVWFDAAQAITHSQAVEIKNYIQSIQPDTLVMFHNAHADISDIHVQEEGSQGLPPANNQAPWENDWYLNTNGYWSFDDVRQSQYTAAQIAAKRDLVNGRNATYALSVSPGPSGKISTDNYNTLLEVGDYPPPQPPEGWIVDDADSAIAYSGDWSHISRAGSYDGTVSHSDTANDYAEYAFNGTGVKLYTQKGPSAGKFDIYIDGVKEITYDSYASSKQYQVLALDKNNLAPGSHTIKLVVTGTKNANSSGRHCHLDFIATLDPPAETIVDDTDSAVAYSGSWSHISRAQSYDGTVSHSDTANDYAQYAFNGTGVKLYTQKGPSAGKFDVYIDGVKEITYDSYASSLQYQVLALDKNNLAPGSHTIKLVVTGTKNANSSGRHCHLDYIKYTD